MMFKFVDKKKMYVNQTTGNAIVSVDPVTLKKISCCRAGMRLLNISTAEALTTPSSKSFVSAMHLTTTACMPICSPKMFRKAI